MKSFKIKTFDLYFENASVSLMNEIIKGIFSNATFDHDDHSITCTLNTPITVKSSELSAAHSCASVIGKNIENIFGCRFLGSNLNIHPSDATDA